MREGSPPTPVVRYFADRALNGTNFAGWYYWFPAEPKIGPYDSEQRARRAALEGAERGARHPMIEHTTQRLAIGLILATLIACGRLVLAELWPRRGWLIRRSRRIF
jgi:hypothetical protein